MDIFERHGEVFDLTGIYESISGAIFFSLERKNKSILTVLCLTILFLKSLPWMRF